MEQLWSDDLITAEVDDLSLDENSSDYLEANEKVRRLMRRMRDDYEQRIDELRDIRVHRETMADEWRQECEKTRSINRELKKRIAELEAENARLHDLLERLTPGGSEFHRNPHRCYEWAVERQAKLGELATERNDLREENARLRATHNAGLESIEAAQVAAYDELTRLRALLPDAQTRWGIEALLASRPQNHQFYDAVQLWLDRLESGESNE